MPTYRGARAFIEMDGKPMEEFGGEVDDENERVFKCFVASQTGKVVSLQLSYSTLMLI